MAHRFRSIGKQGPGSSNPVCTDDRSGPPEHAVVSPRSIEYRRAKGEFYTPPLVVRLVHNVMSDVFGPDWRERYLVWDPCCGTANLTRDYTFSDLILTTLEEADIRLIKQYRYNPGALVRQLDFLNDDIPPEIEDKLRKAKEEGKELIFFMNPPFVDTGKGMGKQAKKSGTVKSKVSRNMKMGKIGRQIFAQFFVRCIDIAETYDVRINLGIFSRAKLYTSISGAPMVQYLNRYLMIGRMVLAPSVLFSGCGALWPVVFTVWKGRE